MSIIHKASSIAVTAAALAAATLAVPASAQFGGPPAPPNTGVPIFATLAGGNASGQATVVIDPPKGTMCYMLNVRGLEDVTAAHIHLGGPGETGAPVVTFEAPADGASGGCAPIAADLSSALLANPDGYYVNVHTRGQPGGAIRGQLAG